MWHSTDRFLSSISLDSIHRCLHARNESITSIQTKSFESIEFDINEIAKLYCIHDSFQYFKFGFLWYGIELLVFDFVSDPITLFPAWNMHVLDTNFATVGG
jgi:hypothetical protein